MENTNFIQEGPQLLNTYLSDEVLQNYLQKKLPTKFQASVFSHLQKIGELAAGKWLDWARSAELHKPKLIQFDEWGRRIDEIVVDNGWVQLEAAAATEGLVATAYERKHEEFSRVYQMALLYLYHPSSAFFSCPLAMTDGAARALELHADLDLKNKALPRLLSRDPKIFWTSGQWMTERTGGSDVSGTSTIARPTDKHYRLYGSKWFTSATKSQMALTLARIEDNNPKSGLSLFYLEKNNLEVLRLKDKLGTDALPTAELNLLGTEAQLVGAPNEGVKRIASVLNITRIYNSICALGQMRRALDLAHAYSQKRRAFGAYLNQHVVHKKLMSDLELEFLNCFRLTFYVVELLGKEEVGKATEVEKKLLRALTPIVKLFTAKKSIAICSEVLEVFGGAGYVENTGIPRLLRDAQVFSIWEGTTNVLALDFQRVCDKEAALETLAQSFGLKSETFAKYKNPEQARDLAFYVAEQVIEALQA